MGVDDLSCVGAISAARFAPLRRDALPRVMCRNKRGKVR